MVVLDGGLEVLDKSNADSDALIQHAATTLAVDLNAADFDYSAAGGANAVENGNFTFRQQWVLRWITRKIHSELQSVSTSHGDANRLLYISNPRLWQLLVRVIYSIPVRACAEILVERKFVHYLDQAIRLILHSSTRSAVDDDVLVTSHGEEGVSAKRRRLSPQTTDDASHSAAAAAAAAAASTLHLSVLRAAYAVATVFGRETEAKDSIATWSQSAKDSSSVLSAVLELAYSAALAENPVPTATKDILSLLGQLCSFWDHRPVVSSDSARNEEIALFYERCLDPCLRILRLLKGPSASSDAAREARDTLESLVAFNAVLPLRKAFLEKTAKSWKSQGQQMSWKSILKVYNALSRTIENSPQPTASATDMICVSWAQDASIVYDIAIRLVPATDLKKRQQEHPWLDALFMFLSYLVCPRLTKFDMVQGQVESVDPVISSDLIDRPDVIDELLATAKRRTHRPSPQVLSSLTYSILTWDAVERPWSCVAGLLDLDADVLVSNSGIATTGLALDALLTKLETSPVGREDYAVILDQIVKPMLEGHARARALKQFISLWAKNLAEALRNSAVGLPPPEQERAAVLVWQDEELFDTFADTYAIHGTAGLTKDLVSALEDDLQGLATRIGSTLNSFSNLAIVNVVIESVHAIDTTLEPAVHKAIADHALAALQKRSDYQGQRWRLWKLIRCIWADQPLSGLSHNISNISGGVNSTSLGDLPKLSGNNDFSHLGVSEYREVLERFSCIASTAVEAAEEPTGAFADEIAGLQLLLKPEYTESLTGPAEVWNGRLEDLHSVPKLVSACLGVILAKPRLLKLVPSLARDVEHLRSDKRAASVLDQPFFEATSDLAELQATGRGLHEWLTAEDLAATDVSALQKLWQDLTRLEWSRAQAQALGDKAFQLLKSLGENVHVPALVYLGVTLECISSKYAVSYTRAEAWPDWLSLLETFDELECQGRLTKDHLHAAHSFGKILRQVWKNCEKGPSLPGILKDLGSRSKAISKDRRLPRPLSPFLALQIAVPSLMTVTSKQSQNIIRPFTKQTLANLSQLTADARQDEEPSEDWLVHVACILDVLLDVGPLLPVADQAEVRRDVLRLQEHFYACADRDASTLGLLLNVQSKCDELSGKLAIKIESGSLAELLERISPLRKAETWQELDSLGSRARSLVSRLDTDGRGRLLTLISQPVLRNKLEVLRPLLVASVVLQTTPDQLATSQSTIDSLDQIASLQDALTARDPLQLALSIENSRLVLEHLPEVVNQNTIDTLLARLCLILSPTQPSKEAAAAAAATTTADASLVRPDAIFDRVCALLNSLLSRYRRRLTDRQHLLLAVTQAMLKCLFFPGVSVVRSKQAALTTHSTGFFRSLPWWLTSSEHYLGRGSASRLSRLLSMICNPTVSAAKSSRKRNHNELNDEIKRVKALAGQHMQYLVMEYARCSLDGEIKVEVKEKLVPGLYMVLDAMGREVMRAMNAAMDGSSRAIFKALYDDWVRHGRWDNS